MIYRTWHIEARQTLSGYVASLTAPDGDTYSTRIPRRTREEAEQDARSLIRHVEHAERQARDSLKNPSLF